MRSESTISKWGNSLAIRIPLAMAEQASLAEGDCVKLVLNREGGIVCALVKGAFVPDAVSIRKCAKPHRSDVAQMT